MNKTNFFYAMVIFGLILSGCASYKPKSGLRSLIHKPTKQADSVAFAYHVFSENDCFQYLDRNVIEKGYQPILITIKNSSNKALYFSTDSFSFPCARPEEVAITVHTNTTARAVGYGVTGIFIWPFLIPAVVDGIGSSQANTQLDADFIRKSLQNQTIKPYSSINGLIFVPIESFNYDFSFTITDLKNDQQYSFSSNTQIQQIK